jgi:hypothetical protein
MRASLWHTRSGSGLQFPMALILTTVVIVVSSARAEIYECLAENGSRRFTNVEPVPHECTVLNIPYAAANSSPRPQQHSVATSAGQDTAVLIAVDREPNPAVTLQTLEAWALGPRDTLDPVTYALVDSDDAVRARAQELWDEVLKH